MSPDVRQPHLDAWRSLLNAHASMVERVEAALSDASLPPLAWYDVLWALYRADGRSLRAGELSDGVVTISRSGLTRLVDRMVAAGLVERGIPEGDRRGVELRITADGSRMLRKMWPVYARVLEQSFVGSLSADEARVIRDALARVNENVR
jgi:DNA-binding MarR family transcriptional regulator